MAVAGGDTSAEAAQPLTYSMTNTKAELVDAAVALGYDQAEMEALTKAEILGYVDEG